jgi:hypothetical protein
MGRSSPAKTRKLVVQVVWSIATMLFEYMCGRNRRYRRCDCPQTLFRERVASAEAVARYYYDYYYYDSDETKRNDDDDAAQSSWWCYYGSGWFCSLCLFPPNTLKLEYTTWYIDWLFFVNDGFLQIVRMEGCFEEKFAAPLIF